MADIILHIPSELSQNQFITLIGLQINKDFAAFGEVVYDNKTELHSIDDLTITLFNKVSMLLSEDKRKMMQIIYRIDISESQLGSAMADARGEKAANLLTQLIIDRESMKIQLRLKSQ